MQGAQACKHDAGNTRLRITPMLCGQWNKFYRKRKNVVKLLPWISCFPDDAQSSTDNKKKQRRMNTPWIEVAEDDAENSTEEEQKVELVVWTR